MSSGTFFGLRARLHAPGPLLFAQTMFPDPGISTILGNCGFDFVMVDAEHGPFTLESLRICIEALKATSAAAVVRTASQSEIEIKQALDLGADGVIVPRIESARDALSVIRAARYAPAGVRGMSRAVRAARFGLGLDEQFLESTNARIAVIAIIESRRGVQNVEAIVGTPGLDGIMVGGDDLSADLGLYGLPEDPRMVEAVQSITAAAISAGLKIGGSVARTKAEWQSVLIHCGNDAIVLRNAFERALAAHRTSVQESTA